MVPVISWMAPFPIEGESFSELWLLGPNGLAADYPVTVRSGDSFDLYLGVGNHLGHSTYYLVYVKFSGQPQLLPNLSTSGSSPLLSVYEFQLFVADNEVWESPVTVELLGATVQDDVLVVESLAVNGKVFQVDCSATWNSEYNGFYFNLFFELWLYNSTSSSFQFHNRFVGLWLNVAE
jgi:uncharacterized membrane protein